jgi:hypothetical protein
VDEYLAAYRRLLHVRVPLVTYVDHRVYHRVYRMNCEIRGSMGVYTRVVPINEDFLKEHIRAFSAQIVKREEEIMASPEYKGRVSHRAHLPEASVPRYNLINHGKIDFVVHTIRDSTVPRHDFYGWVDFGYAHGDDVLPASLKVETKKLAADGVTFMVVNEPEARDGDALYTLRHAPEKFAGGFFAGKPKSLIDFQRAYHANLDAMHHQGVADDDQAVMAHLYYNKQVRSPRVYLHKGGFKGALRWLEK